MNEPQTVSAADITPLEMPTPTAPAASAESGVAGPAVVAPPAPPSPDAEKDDAGVPFDPARHIRHKNRHTGRWMPRGGRKPGVKGGTPAVPSPAPQSASFIPANEPQAPKDDTAAKPQPSSNAETGASKPAENLPDHSSDAGEVACRAAQFAAGVVFDAPDDCVPSPAEHKHMVSTTAAFIRSKGWQSTAAVGLLLMFAVWLLKVLQKPKPRETVRAWFKGGAFDRAQDVTPQGEKPAAASQSPASGHRGEIIDLPANIPPLAKL